MRNFKYLVIGGDLRQSYVASALANCGQDVSMIFSDELSYRSDNVNYNVDFNSIIKCADVIIFPLPISKNGKDLNANVKVSLKSIVSEISPEKIVLGGGINEKVRGIFEEKNIQIYDYLDREELSIYNAVPTAEGAVEIALRELPITIFKSKCLITGYGRISKVLAKILQGMGADVSIITRRYHNLAWAEICRYTTYPMTMMKEAVKDKNIIFNTVPSEIIGKNELAFVDKDCLIIDVASAPGGIDFDESNKLNIKTIWALALPGKVAPKFAGEIIKDTIINLISETKI